MFIHYLSCMTYFLAVRQVPHSLLAETPAFQVSAFCSHAPIAFAELAGRPEPT
jgi:hypothetical protein